MKSKSKKMNENLKEVRSINKNIPIFPLDNVIMLPGYFLPLNIFEKRY